VVGVLAASVGVVDGVVGPFAVPARYHSSCTLFKKMEDIYTNIYIYIYIYINTHTHTHISTHTHTHKHTHIVVGVKRTTRTCRVGRRRRP
jgi:hypothetical protein